jgi:hypothetical protein
LVRIRAGACVSNPVGADVIWIEAPKVSGDEDEVGAGACSIGIHRHALSRAGGVGERVLIVMARIRTTKDPARRTRWTGLRNTAPDEVISMCRIRSVDASSKNTSARCPGWRSRGCPGWRSRGCRSWRAATYRPVNPINLVRTARSRDADRQLWRPSRTDSEAAARVLPGCGIVGLHGAIGPTPLALRSEVHVGLDLDPIRACAEDRRRGEVYRKRRAVYRDWLV